MAVITADLDLDHYQFLLPELAVARFPLASRDQSRLLHVNRTSHQINHRSFTDFADLLSTNDLLIFNNVKVQPCRLFGHSDNLRKHEILVVELIPEKKQIRAVVSNLRKIKIGTQLILPQMTTLQLVEKLPDSVLFDCQPMIDSDYLENYGQMPIPPYLKRQAQPLDKSRYQSIFASKSGAAAAPTASLHFSRDIFDKLKKMQIPMVFTTLYVGLGTFSPVRCQNIIHHQMHSEKFEIHVHDLLQIIRHRQEQGRIVAIGTTALRLLESLAILYEHGYFAPKFINSNQEHQLLIENGRGHIKWRRQEDFLVGETSIFIYPPFSFQWTQALLTNFHTPKSSLLMLVSAFYQRQRILEIYQQAIAEGYRFFSYGDAMFLD